MLRDQHHSERVWLIKINVYRHCSVSINLVGPLELLYTWIAGALHQMEIPKAIINLTHAHAHTHKHSYAYTPTHTNPFPRQNSDPNPVTDLGRAINSTIIQPDMREQMIEKVLAVIDDECSVLCSRSQPTLFRSCHVSELSSFTWDRYVQEMERKSPILLRMLKRIVSHSDHRNEQKKADHHYPGICMCAAVILKERNREIVGVQTHISLALFSSRVQKNVRLV